MTQLTFSPWRPLTRPPRRLWVLCDCPIALVPDYLASEERTA